MKLQNRLSSLVALIMVFCLVALPVSALGKKGKDHYDRGMKYEQAQQWEKAAQEFTMALAADPHNVDYQLHYRRAVFNASQSFMQQGRALAEQRDYLGAYNAFRQAFGYDPVNQLAVSEMERMIRLQEVKEGKTLSTGSDGNARPEDNGSGATPPGPSTARQQEAAPAPKQEQVRVITFSGDLKQFIRKLADDLSLNVMFDKQTFAQPRPIDINLRDVTTAKALDYIFLQEGLFFQKLDRRTILVADQQRRQQFQQLVVRTFYLSNTDPDSAATLIRTALPASVGRPQAIVVPDKYTNSLTVRDTAENIGLIGDLLRGIDKDRAEVVMDVNIYEVSRTDLLNLGNQLGDDTSLVSLGGIRTQASTVGGLARVVTGTGAAATSLPASFGAALIFPASTLQAFQSRNRTKLLASTQVHAFNNEESTARIGQRVPVQTASVYGGLSQNPNPGTPGVNPGVFSNGYPVINYEPTGLTLSFTPQVFPNLDVQVKMKIESKDVSGASTLTPTFTERTISGTARVQNNRTMMLASVTTDSQSQGRKGLPVLGLVPVLGRIFTSPTHDDRQVDIVIAVTPRVLRAPAVTPRDERMRESGTLQAPTTGSIATLIEDAQREEQIAAARQIPKEVAVQLPDAPPTYVPAPVTTQTAAITNGAINTNGNSVAPAQMTSASTTPVSQTNVVAILPKELPLATTNKPDGGAKSEVNVGQNDAAVPAPKSMALVPSTEQPKTLDLASAIKNIVSPGTNVATSSASAKQDATPAITVEQLTPKREALKTEDASMKPTEMRLLSDKTEFHVGEKHQLTVEVKSDAPLGLAVVMLRFDPHVLKIGSISAGNAFANAKAAPTITQSIDEHGMVLVSVTPAPGSALSVTGALLNIEVQAVGDGDSGLAFDLNNVHLIASDGRNVVLQIEPIKLTVN